MRNDTGLYLAAFFARGSLLSRLFACAPSSDDDRSSACAASSIGFFSATRKAPRPSDREASALIPAPAQTDLPSFRSAQSSGSTRKPAAPASFFFRQRSTSSHVTGVDTVGCSRARNEYTAIVVLCSSFWLQSTNTLPVRRFFSCPRPPLGMILLQDLRQRVGKKLRRIKAGRSMQRDVKLQPLGAGSLGKTLKPEMLENFPQPHRHLATLHDICRRPGIEVINHDRRALDVLCQGQRRMQFDAQPNSPATPRSPDRSPECSKRCGDRLRSRSGAVFTQSGLCMGAFFSKNGSLSTPSG